MKKKNFGFTLVEMLVVLAIMGLILIMVFPAVNQLIKRTGNKKYTYHEQAMIEAAKLYLDQHEADLAGPGWTGCVEIDYTTLLNSNLLKKFQDENINCNIPGNKVRITKTNKKESIQAYLICKDTKNGNKIVYKSKTITGKCVATVPSSSKSISNVLFDEKRIGNDCSVQTNGNERYLKGKCSQNYIWYSGKLWRVISHNTSDNTVKMITQWNISTLPYVKSTTDKSFQNSYVNEWLSDTSLDGFNNSKNLDVTYRTGNIELLKEEEYVNSNLSTSDYGFLNNGFSFGIVSGSTLRMVHHSGTVQDILAEVVNGNIEYKAYGVRPVITVKPNTKIAIGTGTIDNPYRFTREKVNANTLLNTRYSGEYVKFSDELYRIVSFHDNKTKLIKVNYLNDKKPFGNSINYTTDSGIGQYLNNEWFHSLSQKALLTEGPWYLGAVSGNGDYRLSKCIEASYDCSTYTTNVTTKVGLPRIGELFAGNFLAKDSNGSALTLTPSNTSDKTINKIDYWGESTSSSQTTSGAIYPKVYLNPNVKIKSGTGLSNDPFILTQ